MANANPTVRSYAAGFHTAWYSNTYVANAGLAGATWYAIGNTRDGWRMRPQIHSQRVQDDAYGEGAPDMILLGADYTLTGMMVMLKKLMPDPAGNPPNPTALWNTLGGVGFTYNNVGQLASQTFGTLCLTPIPGTPAADVIGAGNSYIIPLAGVINDFELPLSSRLMEVPTTWHCLPDPNTNPVNPALNPVPNPNPNPNYNMAIYIATTPNANMQKPTF